MLCTEIVSDIQSNFCTQHVLPMFFKKKSFWQRFTCTKWKRKMLIETPCTCPITSNGRWKELHCGQSVTVLYAFPLREWIRTNLSGSVEEISKANVELVICSLILCWTIEVVLLFVAEEHLQLALSKGAIHLPRKHFFGHFWHTS